MATSTAYSKPKPVIRGSTAEAIHDRFDVCRRPPRVRIGRSGDASDGQPVTTCCSSTRRSVQWRDHQPVSVLATNQRLLCNTGSRGWLSFWFGGVTELYPDLSSWSLTLGFEDGDPLRLEGPATPGVVPLGVLLARAPRCFPERFTMHRRDADLARPVTKHRATRTYRQPAYEPTAGDRADQLRQGESLTRQELFRKDCPDRLAQEPGRPALGADCWARMGRPWRTRRPVG